MVYQLKVKIHMPNDETSHFWVNAFLIPWPDESADKMENLVRTRELSLGSPILWVIYNNTFIPGPDESADKVENGDRTAAALKAKLTTTESWVQNNAQYQKRWALKMKFIKYDSEH